jgi:iron(III) transport system substrate-binding protein
VIQRSTIVRALAAAALAAFIAAPTARAENLTKATEALLKEAKMGPEVLTGLDAELAVPQAWIDGAKKEGLVKIRLTTAERLFAKAWQVFAARYPGIEHEYVRGIGHERAVAALLAFKNGTYVSDVVSSFDVLQDEYEKAGALARIDDLPTYKGIPAEYASPKGLFTAYRLQHWCIGYNPQKLKKAELPKTWGELVESPRWSNGRVGMAVNANVWIPPLAGLYGDKWADDYMTAIFDKLKPQLRKERLSMIPQLNSLGEFDLGIPAGDFIYKVVQKRGMSIDFHCPEPVPATVAPIGILAGNPHPNASKLFVNWVLSKEGQLALHVHDSQIPAHNGMPAEKFLPYPAELAGKKRAPGTAAVVANIPNIMGKWHKLWISAGGAKIGGD